MTSEFLNDMLFTLTFIAAVTRNIKTVTRKPLQRKGDGFFNLVTQMAGCGLQRRNSAPHPSSLLREWSLALAEAVVPSQQP